MIEDRGYLDDEYERVRLIKAVEYLEPAMAKELLCKFPDNSAFDFDYSQSSIWSPVAPRPLISLPAPEIRRLLDLDYDDAITKHTPKMKQRLFCSYKVNKSAVKAVSRNPMNLSFVRNMHNKVFKPVNTIASPAPVKQRATAGKSSKGWDVVLKAASKHFKKRKKKDRTVNVKLSDYDIENGTFISQ